MRLCKLELGRGASYYPHFSFWIERFPALLSAAPTKVVLLPFPIDPNPYFSRKMDFKSCYQIVTL